MPTIRHAVARWGGLRGAHKTKNILCPFSSLPRLLKLELLLQMLVPLQAAHGATRSDAARALSWQEDPFGPKLPFNILGG